MSEQNPRQPEDTQHSEGTYPSSGDAWQEVGKQFQALGDSLATAFRAAWYDEQNRKRVQDMRQGIEQMLNEVGKALDETARSPQVQQAKSEAKKTADSVRGASEQTFQEVRPQIVSALRQLNNELHKFVERLESKSSASAEQGGTPDETPNTPPSSAAAPSEVPESAPKDKD